MQSVKGPGGGLSGKLSLYAGSCATIRPQPPVRVLKVK